MLFRSETLIPCVRNEHTDLKQELFYLDFHAINGSFELRCLIGSNGTSDDRTGNSASSPKGYFAAIKNGGEKAERREV